MDWRKSISRRWIWAQVAEFFAIARPLEGLLKSPFHTAHASIDKNSNSTPHPENKPAQDEHWYTLGVAYTRTGVFFFFFLALIEAEAAKHSDHWRTPHTDSSVFLFKMFFFLLDTCRHLALSKIILFIYFFFFYTRHLRKAKNIHWDFHSSLSLKVHDTSRAWLQKKQDLLAGTFVKPHDALTEGQKNPSTVLGVTSSRFCHTAAFYTNYD